MKRRLVDDDDEEWTKELVLEDGEGRPRTALAIAARKGKCK